ncbi:uncharacterized protein LOC144112839 [Amblyomma americanum]
MAAAVGPRAVSTRASWTDREVECFLALISEKKVSEALDSRRQRNQDVFKDLQAEMANLGYHWTWQQLRNCWKNLKKRFTAERLEQERSGAAPSAWKWYDHMSALLSHRPMVQAREYGVDSQDVPPDYGDNSQLDISDADTRTEEDDADILQEQSEPSTSSRSPPQKRRRMGEAKLEKVLLNVQRKNEEFWTKQSEIQFQQQKQLLADENKHMQELLQGVSTTFLQGTQTFMGQFFSQQAALVASLQHMPSFPQFMGPPNMNLQHQFPPPPPATNTPPTPKH